MPSIISEYFTLLLNHTLSCIVPKSQKKKEILDFNLRMLSNSNQFKLE